MTISDKELLDFVKELEAARHDKSIKNPGEYVVFITKAIIKKVTLANQDLLEFLSALSMGLNPDVSQLPRYIPIRIYISTTENSELIYKSVVNFINKNGFEIAIEHVEEKGSWFKKLIARTLTPKTKDQLINDLNKGRRAVELYGLHKQQAEIDYNLARAASELIKSLENADKAVLQIGSTLIVKIDSKIIARTLTQEELQFIEKNPHIAKQPDKILERLSELNSSIDNSNFDNTINIDGRRT